MLLEPAPGDLADATGPPPPRAGELASLKPVYMQAGMRHGVNWKVLAAINVVETGLGTNISVSSAGAVGWMQFMPGTWRSYGVDASGDGIADPNDPYDAIESAAIYLEASGARATSGGRCTRTTTPGGTSTRCCASPRACADPGAPKVDSGHALRDPRRRPGGLRGRRRGLGRRRRRHPRRGGRPRRQRDAVGRDPVEDAAVDRRRDGHVGRAEALGLAFQHGSPQVDLLRTIAHARYVAAHQSRSIRDRLEGTAARVIHGRARVTAPGTVLVTTDVGEREVAYDRLILATGAAPWEPPFAQVDHARVFTPRDVLTLRRLPEQLVVVGAGATGCEYAEFFLSCGVRVTLLSARPQVLPAEDRDIAEIVEEAFLARGCELQFDARVSDVEHRDDGVSVTTVDGRCFDGTHAVICMGMRPASAEMGLDVLGIAPTSAAP